MSKGKYVGRRKSGPKVPAEALRESEDRYRRLVDSVTDYLFTVRVEEGRAVATHHGAGCVGVTGFTTEEYAADPMLWFRMVHEEDRGKVLEHARRVLANEPVGTLEHRILHKNGSMRWVRNTPVPHHDKDGRLVAYDGLVVDVTERCAAEERLRSELLFRLAIEESMTAGVMATDRTGAIVSVNPGFLRMVDREEGELLGMRPPYVFWPEDRQSPMFQACRGRGDEVEIPQRFEGRFQRRDGGGFEVRGSMTPLLDGKGAVIGRLAVFNDVTEEKLAAQALQEAVEQFRAIIATTTDGFWVADAEGRILDVNDVYCRLSGYTREEILGMRIMDLDTVEEPDETQARIARIMARGSDRFETRHRAKDGRVLDLEISVTYASRTGQLLFFIRDITAHLEAEQALRDSEEKFRTLFEQATDGIMILDLDGTIVDCNRKLYERLGYTREELLGQPVTRLAVPEQATHVPERMALIQELGEAVFESEHRCKDGTAMPVEINSRLLIYMGQAVYFSVVRDITERKKQEDLLRRIADELLSKTGGEYFTALAAFVARELKTEFAFIGQIDGTGRRIRTIAVNAHGQAGENFTYDLEGTPCDTLVGMEARFYPAQVRDLFPRDEILTDMGIESYAGIPLFASGGRALGIFVTMSTRPLAVADRDRIFNLLRIFSARAAAELERREAEESLRRSEEFVKNIVDSVDEAFLVIGRDYRILSCNRAYLAQTGRDPETCNGQYCYQVSHLRPAPCWEAGEDCAVRRTFETGEPQRAVHEHMDAHGGIIQVETKSFPLRDADGRVTGAIEIINNITDRLRLEEQLRQAQKMEAVGLLAGGVAHDFNNILSAIIGYGNLLELKLPPESAVLPYVEQILSASERAANLTQSLLAFSRKQVISPRVLDLNAVIRRIEKLLVRLMGEDIELRVRLGAEPLTVFADGGQLEQILMNLATNARDAMPGGGILTLETAPFSMTESFVRTHGYGRLGEYALLVVSDTGTGMDEAVRARIFEPFFTTKELGRGTGLGLAMVYGAIQQNQGYIHVSSEPGQGAAFRIYLPRISRAAEVAPAASKPMIGGSGTILIAEDDVVVRQLSSAVLREYGYTVLEAVDGEDALERFREHRGDVDLCILDVIMPRMNGKEAYEQLRQQRPDLKALFVSGYTADIVHRKGILESGVNFLGKPVSPQELLAKVREILQET